ncbi:type IV pilus modification PilV family protein [Dactylosporangium sp. CA-139066]|uniref:type IV pilus modification PilV family protein n=1 Tax=Dactylosporangium sp. CA-139066 TaxID=3239930 RepID=UPI003D8B9B40
MRGEPNDRGETLIELLVTVIIMGVAMVALVGGIATSIRMSDIHRKQAQAGAYLRAFGEAIAGATYVECAGTSTYAAYSTGDATYTPTITTVRYWDGSTFGTVCAPDTGIQKVSLKVSTSDNKAIETLDVIIRKPCSEASPCT